MLWLTGIGLFAVGICVGVVFANRFSSASPSKIRELEARIEELQNNHDKYRSNVSEHFGMTAELVQQMTDSYRDVYQHLARGAQDLCSDDIADKLLPGATGSFGQDGGATPGDGDNRFLQDPKFQAPKDYAARKSSSDPGALSESFGLGNSRARIKPRSDEGTPGRQENAPSQPATSPADSAVSDGNPGSGGDAPQQDDKAEARPVETAAR